MSDSEYDNQVEACIKSEMKTLYPEEYERIYGNEEKTHLSIELLDTTINCLHRIINHLNERDSICDLVDDKNQEEIESIKSIWKLSEELCNRMTKIYKNA